MIGSLPLDAPELEGALSPALAAIEARLLEVVSNADETINPPTSHLAEAGGKRLRPILTLLTAPAGRPGPARPFPHRWVSCCSLVDSLLSG